MIPTKPILGLQTLSSGMADASRYFDWVYAAMEPHLGKRVLEIGSGYGNLAQRIAKSGRSYFAVDTDLSVIALLRQRLSVPADQLVIGDVRDPKTQSQLSKLNVDTVISMNVLEHVKNDREHLAMLKLIVPTGSLIVLVPALPFLYGTFDQQAGHVRRYTRKGLINLIKDAGIKPLEVRYFNALGAAAWWMAGRLMRLKLQSESTAATIGWFDRYIIPLARTVDPWVGGHVGQSLLAFAEMGEK